MASGPPFQPPYDPAPSPFGVPSGSANSGDYRWLAPASLPPAPGLEPGGAAKAALYELRPLSTGEILDRTFSLYRSRFLMFAGIASLSATVQLIGQAAQVVVQHAMLRNNHGQLDVRLTGHAIVTGNILGLGVWAIFLLAFAMTQAATVWAMGEVYLGRSATIGSALQATLPGWLRYFGIALWQMGSFLWLPLVVMVAFIGIWAANGRSLGGFGMPALLVLLLIGSFVGGVIFYLRNLLGVPATVREGMGVRGSMRRSKVLAAGAKGKLFLVLLIAFALYMVVAAVMGIMAALTMVMHRGNILDSMYPIQIATLIVGFVGYTLISPVVMIGTALVYFDQRVRKEAFDVAVLLGDESASMAGVPAAPAAMATAPPSGAGTMFTPGTAGHTTQGAPVRGSAGFGAGVMAGTAASVMAGPVAATEPPAGAPREPVAEPSTEPLPEPGPEPRPEPRSEPLPEPLPEPQGGASGL